MLSIVIPAYNEMARLAPTLSAIRSWADRAGHAIEILVVDDGSKDGTAVLVENAALTMPGVHLLRLRENRGKGAAVREGAVAAAGEFLLITDADLSTPIEECDRLLSRMRETDSDIVIGSRAVLGARIEVRQPFWRQGMGKVFNRIMRTATGLPFRDTQCGFKLMGRAKTLPLFRKMVVDRFAYDVELLLLARNAGLRILEEPVRWRNSPTSRVSPIGDSWSMFVDVLRLRRRMQNGFYRDREFPRLPS